MQRIKNGLYSWLFWPILIHTHKKLRQISAPMPLIMNVKIHLKQYTHFYLFTLISGCLAYFMFSMNQYAPVQRDGSHFLFMANNIAHGQNPYWASFETKNPLVEYYWSLFFRLFEGKAHIVILARVAEVFYMFLTALLVFSMSSIALKKQLIRNETQEQNSNVNISLLAGGIASLSLFLLTSWQVTDTGLNIAAYQTLLEGLCILIALALFKHPSMFKAVLLGSVVFSAWFIKQTAVISVGLPLLAILLFHPNKFAMFKYVAVAVATSVVLLLLFFLNLYIQDTLANYQRSTFHFKSLIFSMSNSDFAQQRFLATFNNAFTLYEPQKRFSSYLLVAVFTLPFVALIDVLLSKRAGNITEGDTLRWVVYAWFLGSMIQACMGLTFYPHYFLSAIVPALMSLFLFLSARNIRPILIGVLMTLTTLLYLDYRDEDKTLMAMSDAAPINATMNVLSRIIPKDATVFNWGALSHFHVQYGKQSDYEQNMILPYVLMDVTEEKRKEMFQETFKHSTPDYVIEYKETLPLFTPLRTFPISTQHLKTWTGEDYRVLANYTPPAGRYGLPIYIYVKAALYEDAIAVAKKLNKKSR